MTELSLTLIAELTIKNWNTIIKPSFSWLFNKITQKKTKLKLCFSYKKLKVIIKACFFIKIKVVINFNKNSKLITIKMYHLSK